MSLSLGLLVLVLVAAVGMFVKTHRGGDTATSIVADTRVQDTRR